MSDRVNRGGDGRRQYDRVENDTESYDREQIDRDRYSRTQNDRKRSAREQATEESYDRERRDQDRYSREMRKRENRKRKTAITVKLIILVVLIVVLLVILWMVTGSGRFNQNRPATSLDSLLHPENSSSGSGGTDTPEQTEFREKVIAQAKAMAVQYDYDGAIELLNTIDGAQEDAGILSLLADYETQKSNLVATDPEKVTHIFFHSLVVDPARAFSMTEDETWNHATPGFCQWMTTTYEFDRIMQQMYDKGFVIVSLYDLVERTTDENGVEHVTPKSIYLPQGKTPFVLSVDDLCYYHTHNGRGCASRMIVGENGRPTCEYVTAEGETLVGSYDCVPRLDDFLDQHPDFSYKGAKGTIALTGYDGILGYRTDYCYRDRVDLSWDQQAWLDANPDFDWNAECAAASAVADAIKADGWTFASHTWGHIRVGDVDMDWLKTDTEKWLNYVAPLIGGSDIIVFAHGQDLAAWNEDYASTEKFRYLKSQGFTFYCNVDGASQYFVQTGDEFLRMGRRNVDGYRLWEAVYGGADRVSDLFDAASVIDPARPTDPSLYQL